MSHSINGRNIRIVGMARSGNHAIIQWILEQMPGRWCFLNCVEPSTNPFRTARPISDGDAGYRTTIPDFDIAAERAGRLAPKDAMLFSQEDTFLKIALGGDASAIQEAAVGPARACTDVIILRDPYNLFASRRRLSHQFVTDRTAVRIWKQHARAFLGECRFVGPGAVCISYNDWVRDRGYRRQIAEQLGLEFTDAGIDRVADCAGGSSFDGTRYQRRAAEMRVFDRWCSYADEPTFRALFDRQLADLADRIFGPLPGRALVDAAAEEPRSRRTAAGRVATEPAADLNQTSL